MLTPVHLHFRYEVDCHLVDAAVSQDANVSFSHWRSHFTPSQGDGKKFTMEGIEVEVFGKDGKLSDIWWVWVHEDQ